MPTSPTSNGVLGPLLTSFRLSAPPAPLRFSVRGCSLGTMLVAQSDVGVCANLLGDDPEALIRDLGRRFPGATLIGTDAPGFEQSEVAYQQTVERVVACVEGRLSAAELPLAELRLDLRGTAFQGRVWQLLRTLPSGSTVSYAEIAERLGAPRAVRAVGGAIAANPLAVVIPCHRVIRSDGQLCGYRWGVERKKVLLERERQALADLPVRGRPECTDVEVERTCTERNRQG